jgi:hypothetical protein
MVGEWKKETRKKFVAMLCLYARALRRSAKLWMCEREQMRKWRKKIRWAAEQQQVQAKSLADEQNQ